MIGSEISDFTNEKQQLISQIDDEVQREYEILNKFTTEKFSIILLILGFVGLLITSWDFLHPKVEFNEFFGLWIIATFVLLYFWIYSIIQTLMSVIRGNPQPTLTIEFLKKKYHELINISKLTEMAKEAEQNTEIQEKEIEQFSHKILNYLVVNFDYVARNTETRIRPIALFFVALLFILLIRFENYFGIALPQLQQPTLFFSLPLFLFLILYAALFCVIGFWWRGILIAGRIVWAPFAYGMTLFSKSFLKIAQNPGVFLLGSFILSFYIIGFILITLFLILFPIYADILLILTCPAEKLSDVGAKFFLTLVIMYIFFKLLEILFSIHLVEKIKNDKISWLKRIKFDLISQAGLTEEILLNAKERKSLADVYSPVPYTSMLAFTRYEIIPIYRYDIRWESLIDRLDFLKRH
jgi:hypothetical protein